MMYRWHDGWGWGGWALVALMMLVFWAGVAAVVFALWRGSRPRDDMRGHAVPESGRPSDAALRILDERFAKGEIDADEYTARRNLLQQR